MIKLITFLFTFSAFCFISQDLKAQCDDEMGVFDCADLLGGDTVIYLSDFLAKGKKMKLNSDSRFDWDVYLNKNTNYRFALCCKEGISDKEMILYNDENPEENPCGSTFINGNDKLFFDFHCPKDGMYNICIRFKDKNINKRLCAIGLLGYIGKKH
jgi:hypothetical protein